MLHMHKSKKKQYCELRLSTIHEILITCDNQQLLFTPTPAATTAPNLCSSDPDPDMSMLIVYVVDQLS